MLPKLRVDSAAIPNEGYTDLSTILSQLASWCNIVKLIRQWFGLVELSISGTGLGVSAFFSFIVYRSNKCMSKVVKGSVRKV